MKNILALCDPEKEYAHSLMEYISRKKTLLLKTAAFSNEESLIRFSEKNKIELLLINETMLSEDTEKIRAEKRIILREEKEFASDEESVYKYQSAGSLLRKIMSLYDAPTEVLVQERDWRNKKSIIGVFSPVGGVRKTSFALTLGQIIAKESAALYINMEAFSGLSEILGRKFEKGLSELLYFAGQRNANAAARLPELIVTSQNLDIIPPADSPEDLHGADASEWIDMFDSIMSTSLYNTLILDMGCETEGLAEIFNICRTVYVPVRDDVLAAARLGELKNYLKENGIDEGKVRMIRLPFNKASKLGKDYIENLVWSELGDFTRRLIKEGEDLEQ